MLASFLFAPAFAAQVVFAPQPRPAPPPAPGSQYFDRMLDGQRARLEDRCMSPEGIAIVLEAFIANSERANEQPQEWRLHEEAVAQAVWTRPFDAEALTAALRARAQFRAEREIERIEGDLETFARLNPQDQEAYAQGCTTEVAQGYRKPC